MTENEKTPLISHERRNLLISLVMCGIGVYFGYNTGLFFVQTYIVPTISYFEYWSFMAAWCFCGVFAGWQVSKAFWCTCGI